MPEPGSRKHAHAAERLRNAGQLGDLVCYLITLADDRQKWLAQGTVDGEIRTKVSEALREIAQALGTGAQNPSTFRL